MSELRSRETLMSLLQTLLSLDARAAQAQHAEASEP
jgi:BMFP domain-containing protein YqiC